MRNTKSIWSLRSKSHLNTRLVLRDEEAYARKVLPYISPVYFIFGFIDCFAVGFENWRQCFGTRLLAIFLSRYLFLFARGRLKFATRIFLIVAPYIFAIEYLSIKYNLILTPY